MMTLYDRDDFAIGRARSLNVWANLRAMARAWLANRAARAARRKALKEMAEMPDWQLRDIGIHRGDVDRLMARHGVALDRVKNDFRR